MKNEDSFFTNQIAVKNNFKPKINALSQAFSIKPFKLTL